MAGTLFAIIIMVFVLLIGLGVIYGILAVTKSHRFIVRDPLSRKRYVEQFMMTEKLDKATGVVYWKSVLWQRKLVIPEPPKEACDIGKRGKKHCEAYRLTEDEFVWITDKGINVKEIDGQMTAYDILDDGTEKKIDSFKPFTSTQRQTLINQYTKANEISKKRWGTAEVMGVVSMGGLVLVIAMMLIFGGDLLKEYQQSRAGANQVLQMSAEITRNQALLLQALGIHVDDLEVVIAQTPSAQAGGVIDGTGESPPPFDPRGSLGLD